MGDFPGPYCKEIGLSDEKLKCFDSVELENVILKNGVVFELNIYFNKQFTEVYKVLSKLQPDFSNCSIPSLRIKFNRLVELRKKLNSRKKIKDYSCVAELYDGFFEPPTRYTINPVSNRNENVSALLVESIETESRSSEPYDTKDENFTKYSSISITDTCNDEKAYSSVYVQTERPIKGEADKLANTSKYELLKSQKELEKVKKEIRVTLEKQERLDKRLGHYSVKNVNKRDETARKNFGLLREIQKSFAQQKQSVTKQNDIIKKQKNVIKSLNEENNALKSKLKELLDVEEKVKDEEKKKLHAQKTASYFRLASNKLREQLKHDNSESNLIETVKLLKIDISEKSSQILDLEKNQHILQEQMNKNFSTRNNDGAFSDNIRMCIIELSGLEVAVEKVTSVIMTVAKHMFGKVFEKSDLPGSTTVQSIVDEGHYIAKTFVSEKLSETESWGLNRNGTTRRKQKILDTSITLASGDIISLGFNRVAHETAESINNVTKRHVNELADLNVKVPDSANEHGSYIKSSLEKLAFTMSDRASNEKKADQLLDEWRDSVLENTNENQHNEVLHFHCMAHVLLGFHRYSCKDIANLEKQLVNENGLLGRDSLACFKNWAKKGTIVERVVRTVSDVFGPSGDHHGVRDLWEAHCSANAIKSVIGNYRDNRFNALFQTAGEVFVHHSEFLKVLESVKTPNLKLKSVIADLKSDIIMTLLQGLGLVYVKITGPYWNLVTSGKVPYLELYKHVSELRLFLDLCSENPANMLLKDCHWSDDDPLEISCVPNAKRLSDSLFILSEDHRELLLNMVKLVTSAMIKTIDKQLVDFLPEGQFSETPSESDLNRTKFAHVTNLGCEHHFGDLDSSQRRRPSATMHHHSSVQLLKRNRVSMMKWLNEMPEEQRENLLKSARKGGKELREKHLEREKLVLAEIHEDIIKNNNKSKKVRKRKRNSQHDDRQNRKREESEVDSEQESYSDREEEASLLEKLPVTESLAENVYVAVAYHDSWYPGFVTKMLDNSSVCVKFLSPTRKLGHYQWPSRDDIQTVHVKFIIKSGFIPECLNSGRLWKVDEFSDITAIYNSYRKFYF